MEGGFLLDDGPCFLTIGERSSETSNEIVCTLNERIESQFHDSDECCNSNMLRESR